MSQNNFKSSSTTQNWRKLQHAAILSCWRYFSMLRLSKNSYLDDSAHKHLMILRTNFEMFYDSAHEFWRMIAWWKRCHPYTLLLAYIKIFAKKITQLRKPTTTFSFNWIFVRDSVLLSERSVVVILNFVSIFTMPECLVIVCG